jgi:acetyl esterase
MTRLRRSLLTASSAVACLAIATAAHAAAKATIIDRIEQVVSTFTGDPAAGVDIDMKHVLDRWRGMHPKPLETVSVDDARRQPTPIEAAALLLKDDGKTLDPYSVSVKETTFPGPDGPLNVRIYTPAGQSPTPRPVVVFYHGGGFVLENSASTDASSRAISGTAGYIVVAPDYRLAPEHKFPAAQDDSLSAYKWVTENAASFGGDPDRLALAGEGAGGLLAADTAIAAHRQKLPKAAALVLITPAAGINLKTNSWMEDSAARPWNDKAVAWALNQYLPKPDDRNDPRIDLVGKADVSGLPPTTIVTAEIDPLRSDGERLGGKLKIATVPVAMRDYPGVTHDFFGMGAAVDRAAEAQKFVADQLKAAFAPKADAAIALEDLGIAPYPTAPDPATAPPAMPPAAKAP